jgi:hypothetical protein
VTVAAPDIATLAPSTDAPDVAPVTLMTMATGNAQGSARQSWLQDVKAIPMAATAARRGGFRVRRPARRAARRTSIQTLSSTGRTAAESL